MKNSKLVFVKYKDRMNNMFTFITCVVIFLCTNRIESQPLTNKVLKSEGIDLSVNFTNDFLDNVADGLDGKPTYEGLLSPVITFDLNRMINWNGARLLLSANGTFGTNFNQKVGAEQGIDNIEAFDTWKIYEFWIEQDLFNNAISLKFGLYDLNSEFDVTESSLVFLNPSQAIGVEFSQTGKNGPSIFPTTSLAFRARYKQKSGYYAQAAIFDGVPGDPNDPSGNHIILNRHNGALLVAETGFKNETDNDNNSYGKYAIGCWYYTANFKLPNTSTVGDIHKGNLGFYGIAEKQIYSESNDHAQGLSMFIKLGHAEDDLNRINNFVGMGLVYKGLFTNQDEDVLGLAVAVAHTSNWYWQKLKLENINKDRSEIDYELTYSIHLLKWLNLQPDFQYLFSPLYSINSKQAFIMGIRVSLKL